MKTVHKTVILALAAVCLLALPALSTHWDNNRWDRGMGINQGGWMLLADDVTEEDLNNMTLAEIKELREQKMQELQNTTPAEVQELMEQKAQELENMTLAEIRDMRGGRAFIGLDMLGHGMNGRGMAGYFGGFGPVIGPESCEGQAGCRMGGFAGLHGRMWMLLVDDATRDDLQNMTLTEIDELRQQKMQELENMTLGEIQDLREQKMQELQNTTLAELKEQEPQRGGWIGGWGGPFMGPGRHFRHMA